MIRLSLRSASAALAGLLFMLSPALGGELRPWDAAAFDAAQAAGQPVLIHVTAPWCPTCRAQKPTVEALAADPAHPDLLVLDVDFDSQKDVLRRFGVRQQSTLIAFDDGVETGRSVGVTQPGQITALVAGNS